VLKGTASQSWRGKSGEKHQIIVLQFIKAQEIVSIDIGNSGMFIVIASIIVFLSYSFFI
jgi:hypothetical protein